jgi:hypothetical protein
VLACSEGLNDRVEAERIRIARAVASTFAKRGGGTLWITANERSSGRLRHTLSQFARGVADDWEAQGVTVCSRFGSGLSESDAA